MQRAPGFPCALCSSEGETKCKARAIGVARMRSRVPIRRCHRPACAQLRTWTGRPSTPRPIGSIMTVSGILDRPDKPGDDTSFGCATLSHHDQVRQAATACGWPLRRARCRRRGRSHGTPQPPHPAAFPASESSFGNFALTMISVWLGSECRAKSPRFDMLAGEAGPGFGRAPHATDVRGSRAVLPRRARGRGRGADWRPAELGHLR